MLGEELSEQGYHASYVYCDAQMMEITKADVYKRQGIDWIMRRSCSVLAPSVLRFLPSGEVIFKPLQLVMVSFPSSLRRFFRTRQ